MTTRRQYENISRVALVVALEAALKHIYENHHLAPPSPQLKSQMETALSCNKAYEDMPLSQTSEG